MAVLVAASLLLHLSDDAWESAFCLAVMAAAIALFYRFRCPRCGAIFVTPWSSLFGQRTPGPLKCKSCGLGVNEIPGEATP